VKRRLNPEAEKLEKEIDELVAGIALALIPAEERTPERTEAFKNYFKALPFTAARRKFLSLQTTEQLDDIRKRLPEFPPHVRRVLSQTYKTLPHNTGGRKKRLTEEECHEICSDLAGLLAEMEMPEAQKRTATRHNLSVRSVQRAWQKRAPKSPPSASARD
jgi:hypothetical protein